MNKIILLSLSSLSALSFSSGVLAQCALGEKTVFSCLTSKNKQIEVCDAGKTLSYSFGKVTAKPEIVLSVMRDQASTTQWQGMGRYMSYSVNIPNGDTNYNVFWGVDRLSDDHAIEAGVNVEVKQKLVATVKCAIDKEIIQNIEDIDLRTAE